MPFSVPTRRALRAVIAPLAALALATPAQAGIATVHQCRGPHGGADTDLISAAGNPSIVVDLNGCTSGGGAAILSTGSAGANGGVANKTLTFSAPGDLRFAGGTLRRQMQNYPYMYVDLADADSWGFGYVLTNGATQLLERCAHSGGGPSIGACSPAYAIYQPGQFSYLPTSAVTLPAATTKAYSLEVGCEYAWRCYHHANNPGLVGISAALRVIDEAAPGATAVTGPLATAAPIRKSDRAVSVSASDIGGLGVYELEVRVDGAVVDRDVFTTNGGKCVDADPDNAERYEWLSGHPCPTSASNEDFQVNALPEGEHDLELRVIDAAGNSTIALDRRVTIDLVEKPTSTAAPTISGTAAVGRSLVAGTGAWNDDGAGVPSYSYQWRRCEAAATGCVDVVGATGPVYDLTEADARSRLVVAVTATTTEGSTTATSPASVVVPAPAAAPAPVPPAVAVAAVDLQPAVPGTPNGTPASARATLTAGSAGRVTVRSAYGRPTTLAGRLVSAGGEPIAGARLDVHVSERAAGAAAGTLPPVVTDAVGVWRVVVPAGASRIVRVGYSDRVGAAPVAVVEVDVLVRAAVRLRLSRARLRNGQTLRYLGRLLGPGTAHRFAEVQVRSGRRWQIVCSVRTDAVGAFACAHRFRRTWAPTRYVFRARVRRQSGLPYEPGTSAPRSAFVGPR